MAGFEMPNKFKRTVTKSGEGMFEIVQVQDNGYLR